MQFLDNKGESWLNNLLIRCIMIGYMLVPAYITPAPQAPLLQSISLIGVCFWQSPAFQSCRFSIV